MRRVLNISPDIIMLRRWTPYYLPVCLGVFASKFLEVRIMWQDTPHDEELMTTHVS